MHLHDEDLIDGNRSCTLSVTIKNHGETGYRPELYGDSIVIERHFTRNGTSGFKMKSASGRIISTKRYDLDEISDHFALQLDNPMNVLTQDMARQFLNNSSAADKYRFFVKGTQLEQLDNDYHMIEQYADTIEDKIIKRQEAIEILEQRYKQADNRRKTAERNESIRDRIQEVRRQMAWAQVEEQERELEVIEEQLETMDDRIEQRTTEAQDASAIYQGAHEEFERVTSHIGELKTAIQPHHERLAEVEEHFNANKNQLIGNIVSDENVYQ